MGLVDNLYFYTARCLLNINYEFLQYNVLITVRLKEIIFLTFCAIRILSQDFVRLLKIIMWITEQSLGRMDAKLLYFKATVRY